jgi:hypothetical protein
MPTICLSYLQPIVQNRKPAALTAPLIIAVIKATVSAFTCQWFPTEDHIKVAGPIPIGVIIIIVVNIAIGERAKSFKSTVINLNRSFNFIHFFCMNLGDKIVCWGTSKHGYRK